MRTKKALYVVLIALFLTALACGSEVQVNSPSDQGQPTTAAEIQATTEFPNLVPGDYTREIKNWPGRPYTIHIPDGYNPSKQFAVVLAIHGGGANSESAAKVTCPNGKLSDPKCLNKLADREGFVVVYPNGTSNPGTRNIRTWNAGGGEKGYLCVSEYACKNNIDDIKYFQDLLDDLEMLINIDKKRIFATGISNGAAMSHRLACELSDQIAAIAPIAGGNQFGAVSSCAPSRAIPVLQIHGTSDPAWPYDGGIGRLGGGKEGVFISAPKTVSEWAARNNCDTTPIKKNLPDKTNDGTKVTQEDYTGCRDGASIVFITINGGGHTWPQGNQYLSEFLIGKTSQDINTNEIIWEFFKKHPIPEISN